MSNRLALALLVLTAVACGRRRPDVAPAPVPETAGAVVRAPLKDAFSGAFLVGAALNAQQFYELDTLGVRLVTTHFNSITPENVLKWEQVHPRPGVYDWRAADRYVEFGEKHGMFIVGHTLVWHSQVPRWVFHDFADTTKLVSRDTLLARMQEHISTVVGRYKGRIKGWDVVNEAINDENGALRNSLWRQIIGDDFIARAFQFAREADPDAELYYNDYNLSEAPKREGAVRLVRGLLEQGLKVSGIGTQEHHKIDYPSPAQVDSSIAAFGALGVKVHVTELDVDMLPRPTRNTGADIAIRADSNAPRIDYNPYPDALPDSLHQALARRYASMFEVYWRHRDVLDRVTFWGVRDSDSWLNGWPMRGRTNYPLLFDRAGNPKPAYDAVIQTARPPTVVP